MRCRRVTLMIYLGGVHDLLAYVHLSESLEHSQESNVQSLPGDLVVSSSMIPVVASQTLKMLPSEGSN